MVMVKMTVAVAVVILVVGPSTYGACCGSTAGGRSLQPTEAVGNNEHLMSLKRGGCVSQVNCEQGFYRDRPLT